MTEHYNRGSERDRRRELRGRMPQAEVLLWSQLRRGQLLDSRFRRQYSVGPFIVDFYCPQRKLAIELDGDSHFSEEARAYDARRQRFIEEFGIRFLRFTNQEVLDNLDGVLEVIARAIEQAGPGKAGPRTDPDPGSEDRRS